MTDSRILYSWPVVTRENAKASGLPSIHLLVFTAFSRGLGSIFERAVRQLTAHFFKAGWVSMPFVLMGSLLPDTHQNNGGHWDNYEYSAQ